MSTNQAQTMTEREMCQLPSSVKSVSNSFENLEEVKPV